MRILVVDDDRRLCGIVKRGLLEEAYAVDVAHDGEDGEDLAEVNPYDLIILDVMMPKKDGVEVCNTITFRLTIWYLLVLGIILILLSTGVYLHLWHSLYTDLDESLQARAAQLGNMRRIATSIMEGTFHEELGEVVSLYLCFGDELLRVSSRDKEAPSQYSCRCGVASRQN
jgi:hypothetical protein